MSLRRGFTLLESAAAIALLGVVLLVVVQLVGRCVVQQRELRNRQIAILEVGNLAERWQGRDWDRITPENAKKETLSEPTARRLPDAELTVVVESVKPDDAQPAMMKPAEAKPEKTKLPETKPAAAQSAETKPADAKPAAVPAASDAKSKSGMPAATKPAEAKPAEAKAVPAASVEAKRIVVRLAWRDAAGRAVRPVQVVAWKYRRAGAKP